MDNRTIGILGGGQLGRMMVEAAHRLNIKTAILDAEGAPAKQINAIGDHVHGKFTDPSAVLDLAKQCDVLTVEIEHVNVDALDQVKKEYGDKVDIQPTPDTIRLIQDKYLQKKHFIEQKVATADAQSVESTIEDLKRVGNEYGYPYMLKSRTNAYDGKGNFVVTDESSVEEALKFLSDRPLYAEKWAPFVKEVAVMVVRSTDGSVSSYPTVETIHKNNICHTVFAPARVQDSARYKAQLLAEHAVSTFSGAGIFGVEMFLLQDGELLLNEIAPRPHNSGHYTQDACVTSQFEAHVRAVLGLPLTKGFTSLNTPSTHSIMLNILGGDQPNSELETCRRALNTPGANVHLYGKSTRPNRKMGHINIVASSMSECEKKLAYIEGETDQLASDKQQKQQPIVGMIMGSDSDLPVMKLGADILKKFNIPFEVKIVSAHRTPDRMNQYAREAASKGIKAIIAGAGGAAHLPGMVAAMTPVPVIGVPVKGSSLDGVDSLHSIVQMPRGIPVATVAINNSTNAALLAIRIVGACDPIVQGKMEEYMNTMEKEVLEKTEKLERIGYEEYLAQKK